MVDRCLSVLCEGRDGPDEPGPTARLREPKTMPMVMSKQGPQATATLNPSHQTSQMHIQQSPGAPRGHGTATSWRPANAASASAWTPTGVQTGSAPQPPHGGATESKKLTLHEAARLREREVRHSLMCLTWQCEIHIVPYYV